MLETFSSKLDWIETLTLLIISITKAASKKIGALIRSMKFHVVLSGLVLLISTWNC